MIDDSVNEAYYKQYSDLKNDKSDSEISTLVRRANPLNAQNPTSILSSFTYQITLYISTPEAYTKFVSDPGSIRLEDGYYVVAQSGGLGQDEKRALSASGSIDSNKGLDFYIDDLNFEMLFPGGDKTTSASTQFNFKIIEPIGFTFFTKMSILADQINKKSTMISGAEYKPHLFQQYYMLGIRFYGYDKDGNIAVPSKLELDHNKEHAITDPYAMFERFFPIKLTKATYKLDGKAVTYAVEAVSENLMCAFGSIHGTVKNPTEIVAGTVFEALSGGAGQKSTNASRSLIQILNEQQELEKETSRINGPTVYQFEWAKDADTIKNSKLTNPTDPDLKSSPMSKDVNVTRESNVKQAVRATSYTTEKRRITVEAGTPVLTVIENIIAKSEYIIDRIKSNSTTNLESETQKNKPIEPLNWFTVNPIVIPKGLDNKTKLWYYEITYQIQAYYIPYLRSLYKGQTKKYYGPHKKYYYHFSGLNSEVINYEQEYNNQFYMIKVATTTSENADIDKNATAPVATHGGPTGRSDMGKSNKGSQVSAQLQADINSIADQATAKIKILGDPDYLMTSISGSPKFSSPDFKKLYGVDGFTINPYGGQIFVEIIFFLADDYNDNGLLNVSDSVKFYSTSPEIAREHGIEGIVYRVIGVKHMFNRGQFTQELDLIVVSERELGLSEGKTQNQREANPFDASKTSTSNRGGGNYTDENQSAAETNRLNRQAIKNSGENQSAAETNRLNRSRNSQSSANDDQTKTIFTPSQSVYDWPQGRET